MLLLPPNFFSKLLIYSKSTKNDILMHNFAFLGFKKSLGAYVGTIFFRGGQFAHPRKFLGGGGVRMGAQTEKIKEGGLGCANRVRKGFLGGGSGAQGCALWNFFSFCFFFLFSQGDSYKWVLSDHFTLLCVQIELKNCIFRVTDH